MKFGIELELLIPQHNYAFKLIVNKLEALGIAIKWEGFSHNTTQHWKLVTDASVSKMGYVGYELVSPILEDTKETFEQIEKICQGLIEIGCVVDTCCGLHVHVDASTVTLAEAKIIYKRYQLHETKIDSWMHARRRTNLAQHCRSIVSQPINESANNIDGLTSNRYFKLNLKSFVAYGTIEFRHHAGTLDSQKIIYWIMFIRGFMKSCREIYLQQKRVYEEKEGSVLAATKKVTKTSRTFTDKLCHEITAELCNHYRSKRNYKYMLKICEFLMAEKEKLNSTDPAISATSKIKLVTRTRSARYEYIGRHLREAMGLKSIQAARRIVDSLSWITSNSRMLANSPVYGLDYPFYVGYDAITTKSLDIALPVVYAALKQICDSRHSLITQKKIGLWGPPSFGNFDKSTITIERNDDLFRSIEPYVRNFYVERMEDLRNAA